MSSSRRDAPQAIFLRLAGTVQKLMRGLLTILSCSALYALIGLLLLNSRLAAGAPQHDLPPGHQRVSVLVGGLERQFVLHLPAGDVGGHPKALVIMLHGMGGTAANAVRETGWSAKADAEGFVVAYPDATRPDMTQPANFRRNPQAWSDGSGRFHSGQTPVDDTAFIRALIDHVAAKHAVDARRIFVTGFSNGASMVFRIGAEMADRVAAIAPVAGASWAETVRPTRPISLLYLTGEADPLNPLAGGMPRLAFGGDGQGGRAKTPIHAQMTKWAVALGLPATPVSDAAVNGVRTTRYGVYSATNELVVITVEGLGHVWAGGQNLLPEFVVGKPTDKLRATDVIWEFFKAHPGP
jgi:polyhydroxybutyrate depolymerase